MDESPGARTPRISLRVLVDRARTEGRDDMLLGLCLAAWVCGDDEPMFNAGWGVIQRAEALLGRVVRLYGDGAPAGLLEAWRELREWVEVPE